MDFRLLQVRLIASVKERLRSGELTERGLAHRIEVSQPHLHNVLKGVRSLSVSMADQILNVLRIDLIQLFEPARIQPPRTELFPGYQQVPVLEGRIGPGHPFPSQPSRSQRYPFAASFVALLHYPVLAGLAEDPFMSPVFQPNDLVLLDRSGAKCAHPEISGYYALERGGEGSIRRVRRVGPGLYVLGAHRKGDPPGGDYISLHDRNILDIVKAKVVWMGRHLEPSPIATRPPQQAG